MADTNPVTIPSADSSPASAGWCSASPTTARSPGASPRARHAHGAKLAFTYQGDALKKRVEPLARELDAHVVGHCDVTDPASIDAVFAAAAEVFPEGIDFVVHCIAFSDKDELTGRYVETTEAQLHQVAPDLLLLVHGHRPARREADAQRRLAPDADLLRRREVDAALQRHGRRQGRARGLRALPRRRSRPAEDPRQRDLGRPDQDARRLRHRRLPLHPEVERVQRAPAPDGDHRGGRRDREPTSSPTCPAA